MNTGKLSRYFILFILLILLSVSAKSQYFITGQDAGSTKWRQIKTKDFQVIFPDNYAQWAQYYINVLSLTGPVINADYNSNVKRISVILHNQTTTSNAYAAIAPMRLDLLEMPGQYIYPQIWQDQLALHEYRHTVQQYKLRQGLTKGLYYVLGDQGVAFIMGVYLPFWFIEGDAVYGETVYSSSGRGRVPNFIYLLKAQVLDKKIYKYDKASFGSFRDFVPDHYTLGYQLMAKGVEAHGVEMWDWTMNRVARRPYYLVPFTTSIKKQTGKFKVQYYNNVLSSLKQDWWIHDKPEIDSTVEILSPAGKHFTNYLFPNEMEYGSVIVEKTGLDDINRFVRIKPNGTEERIFTPGYDFRESLSVSANKICWNERTYDPRWSLRNYSVIKLYDLETGKLKKITSKTRYFAPDLSSDGSLIVTVYISEESKYFLHVLDANTGEIIKEIATGDNLFFATPHWSEDDKYIVATILGKKGKSIARINTENWNIGYVLPFSFKETKWPIMIDNWVVYTGTYEGKDNIYAVNANSGHIFKVFEARFGANYMSFSKDGKFLYFSYYTADGQRLAKINFNPASFERIIFSNIKHEYLADRLVKPQTFNLDETKVPDSVYEEKKYSKAGHLFNLHSWAPVSIDADNYTINPGVTLMSQNKLSTAVTTLGYLFDINEQTSKVSLGFDYYGWYPVIGFNIDYGGRRGVHQPDTGALVNLKWRETNISLSLSLPLNFTSSKWAKGIQPIIGVDQKFLKMDKNDGDYNFSEDNFTAPFYRFYAYNQYKRSPKDIYPKWGQTIDLIYRDTPFSNKVNSQFAATAWFYFPGIVRHQGIRVYGGYQNTVTGNYGFSNFVAVPRGYTNVNLAEYVSIRSDYAFPIAYPDLNVPSFFYLKRIYSKVFYDYLQGNDTAGILYDLSSTGIELYTDWHFLSILVNINLGVRVSHRFYDGTQQYEFLFGFSY